VRENKADAEQLAMDAYEWVTALENTLKESKATPEELKSLKHEVEGMLT
jgi:hypothetical protein